MNFKEFLTEGVYDIKSNMIANKITGFKDTPEDKIRFFQYIKDKGLGNSNDASKAWKSFQVTKEIFAPGKPPESTKESKKSSLTDADVKKLEKAWADVNDAYNTASKLSEELLKKVKDDNKGVEVHIKKTPDLYAVMHGLDITKPSTDFSSRIKQIRGYINDVVQHYKKI